MRRALLLIAFAFGCATALPAGGQQIHGSGSTFVYPVLAKWSEAYQKVSGVHVEYQPLGSSGGLTEIRAGVVDFGVSDAPLFGEQLLRDGLAQFPVVIGAIVPVVNLDGITAAQLRFTGQLLADIYLGKVKTWSDPAIAALNPGIVLPDRAILVIHRSDGSGTTFNWTDYLSKVSAEWKTKVGSSTLVAWPTGAGGKGNSGVAENVARVKGAIGYVEYGYAQRKKLSYALVQNRAGNFVLPDMSSFRAATTDIDWARVREFNVSLTDAPRADAYPIMAASFALIRRYPKDVGRSMDVLAFFRWALENGQELATSLYYLPLPPQLVQEVEGSWNAEREPAATGRTFTRGGSQAPG
jgi:phosphate transport system substrate-binding protein